MGYLGGLFYFGLNDALGADPVKTLIHNSGLTAVILLLITLVISPLAQRLPCADLIKFRRLFGVYAFFAALYHLSIFTVFDLQMNIALLISEIIRRPYITVGLITFILLLALSLTSFDRIKRKMGKHWQSLHNYVYLTLFLALLHFSWSEKTLLQTSLYYWLVAFVVMTTRSMKIKRLFKFK